MILSYPNIHPCSPDYLVPAGAGALVLLGDVPAAVHPAVGVQHRPLYAAIGLIMYIMDHKKK